MPVCFNVFNPKSPFWRKMNHKTHLVRYKTQLLEKNCILGQGWERASHKATLEVHFRIVYVRSSTIRWTLRAITKLPVNKSCTCPQFSRMFLIPFISSLCSALCPETHSCLSSLLSALPSPCCYKPLHGNSLSCLLSSIESSSFSSSFFVFFNAIPLYFF